MPTMYRRKKDQASRWPKVLHKLSRLVSGMRSQAFAYIAIAQAQRSVERKIKAAGSSVSRATQNKNE
ncbi:hypothetical protein UFOVP77_33 [uncultured Caudovirales phage]|uniref:Uncharacterized protein n=1 Tax=uncultured Caudovirales phage TaxID=2100421 RepID=A0A6J5L0X1_9CAUD|nr:hypothetical protein UFOVP77_33 [uncultured Caudovirales phage]